MTRDGEGRRGFRGEEEEECGAENEGGRRKVAVRGQDREAAAAALLHNEGFDLLGHVYSGTTLSSALFLRETGRKDPFAICINANHRRATFNWSFNLKSGFPPSPRFFF